jgi:hypothetical protein
MFLDAFSFGSGRAADLEDMVLGWGYIVQLAAGMNGSVYPNGQSSSVVV